MKALGIDLGTRRIGVAVSAGGGLALPHSVMPRTADRVADRAALASLVGEVGATCVVVGLPLSLDGRVGRAAHDAQTEAAALADLVSVPVETHDERFSTVTATRSMRTAGADPVTRRQTVDRVAAAVMLQGWLDHRASRCRA